MPIAAAAAIVVVVIVLTVLLDSGGSGGGFDVRTSATIPSGHAADAVIRDGDTVRGAGEVIPQSGGRARFCAPVALTEGQHCPLSVALTGVHASKSHPATITGVYRNGTIAVSRIAPYRDPQSSTSGRDVVPCAAPGDGWPDGRVDMAAAQQYQRAHPSGVVLIARLRPTKTAQVVYVVTAGDPSAAGTALTKTYGDRLCVVPSPFSARQIAAAKQLVVSHMGSRLTDVDTGGGPTIDSHGTIEIEADVPIIDDSFAKAVDAQPAGLVQLTVWLRPAG